MRAALIVLHRWVALVTGAFVVVVAVSGASLVFEGAIDRALNPQLWRATPGPGAASLDTIAAHARAATAGPLTGLGLTTDPGRAVVAQVGPMQVFVDPSSASVLGTRDVRAFQRTLPRRLHVLHTALLSGPRGSLIVTLVTIVALALVLTGVILWWPDKLLRVNWRASWKRVNFDLHHALGSLAALVLIVIASSGVIIHFDALRSAIARLDTTPRKQSAAQSTPSKGAVPISLDSLAATGRHALPGANITFLNTPPKPDQPFVVSMRFAEDRTPGGRSRVVVDRFTGSVLLAESTREAPAGTRINNVMRSVHTGDLFGNPTRALWLFAALVLAQQAVSGALMWWNARRARAAQKSAAA